MNTRGGILGGILVGLAIIGLAVVLLALALVQCGDEQTVRLRQAQLASHDGGGCDSDGGYCSGEDNRGIEEQTEGHRWGAVSGVAGSANDHGNREDGCESDGGYCAGSDERGDCRDTDQPCSDDDFSPRFDDSPVDHSFNPNVCVMPGSCTGGEPPPEDRSAP